MSLLIHRLVCQRWRCANSVIPLLSILKDQVLIHLLASIHPTYRATTNPMQFVPDSWRDYKPSFSSPGWVNSAAPDIGQAPGELPEFEDLRGNSALDTRRRANAVFVVLGAHAWPFSRGIMPIAA